MKKNVFLFTGFFGAGFVGGTAAANYYHRSPIPGIFAEMKELHRIKEIMEIILSC